MNISAERLEAFTCAPEFVCRGSTSKDGSHGLTVTLNRDNRDVLHGREARDFCCRVHSCMPIAHDLAGDHGSPVAV